MSRRLPALGMLAGALISTAALTAIAQSPPEAAPPVPPAATSDPTTPSAAPVAPAVPPSASAQLPPEDRADELFARGNDAFDKGQLDEAYSLYQQAWALKRTYDIAGNLGQVELKLGKFRDAAEHLDFTLRLFPPTGKSEPREAIRRAFDAARKEVGALVVTVNVEGAKVSVDGKEIGLSPFDAPVFVEPGKRSIEASLEAHLPTRISIDIAKNESRDVGLSLTPKNQPPPPPRNVPLLITGFGLSLAAAGTGIGLMIVATDKGTAADTLLRDLVTSDPDGKCPCGSDAERARLKSLRQDHDLFFNVAVGMFVGAGVLAAGATAYALTPSFQRPQMKSTSTTPGSPPRPPRPPRVALPRVVPVVTDQGGGALVIGTF